MIKGFYKKTNTVNYFFNKNLKVRSMAFGEQVKLKFAEWKKYYLNKKNALKSKFVLSAQDDVFGRETERLTAESFLPPLCASGTLLTVMSGGHVKIDGVMIKESVGTELKGWALMPITSSVGTVWHLCVIGKPEDKNGLELTIYQISDDNKRLIKVDSVKLQPSMDIASFITCFATHVFIVHNGTLDYYYFNTRVNKLERVAIGSDGDNNDFEWCLSVAKKVVCCGQRVFWQSENNLYSFVIGYPLKLNKIVCNEREITEDIFGSDNGLIVKRKDKNSGRVIFVKYAEDQTGYVTGQPIQEFALKQLIKL